MNFKASATSAEFLRNRLDANKNFSSTDFHGWLLGHLNVKPDEDVLDVGCGTGAQTIPLSRIAKSVSAFDISSESVEKIRSEIGDAPSVQISVGDMAAIDGLLAGFSVKKFDVALCVYALYYADDWQAVLKSMHGALKPGGRCAICAPCPPHGLVDLAGRFSEIPAPVLDSISFARDKALGFIQTLFPKLETFTLKNEVTVPSADALIDFYKSTTYYDERASFKIRALVEEAIDRDGAFNYEKNSILIIGHRNA